MESTHFTLDIIIDSDYDKLERAMRKVLGIYVLLISYMCFFACEPTPKFLPIGEYEMVNLTEEGHGGQTSKLETIHFRS